jgi:hypothetical protein
MSTSSFVGYVCHNGSLVDPDGLVYVYRRAVDAVASTVVTQANAPESIVDFTLSVVRIDDAAADTTRIGGVYDGLTARNVTTLHDEPSTSWQTCVLTAVYHCAETQTATTTTCRYVDGLLHNGPNDEPALQTSKRGSNDTSYSWYQRGKRGRATPQLPVAVDMCGDRVRQEAWLDGTRGPGAPTSVWHSPLPGSRTFAWSKPFTMDGDDPTAWPRAGEVSVDDGKGASSRQLAVYVFTAESSSRPHEVLTVDHSGRVTAVLVVNGGERVAVTEASPWYTQSFSSLWATVDRYSAPVTATRPLGYGVVEMPPIDGAEAIMGHSAASVVVEPVDDDATVVLVS